MNRILLIHPDTEATNELTFLLQHSGFQVVTTADEHQVFAEIHGTKPDVIIMAEALAEINGDEPCTRIREICETPIIILGEHKEERAGIHFLEAGGGVYIASPLEPRLLLAWVRSLLRRSKTRIPSPLTGEDKGEGNNWGGRPWALESLKPKDEVKLLLRKAQALKKVDFRRE